MSQPEKPTSKSIEKAYEIAENAKQQKLAPARRPTKLFALEWKYKDRDGKTQSWVRTYPTGSAMKKAVASLYRWQPPETTDVIRTCEAEVTWGDWVEQNHPEAPEQLELGL